jgi:hypothetical protein
MALAGLEGTDIKAVEEKLAEIGQKPNNKPWLMRTWITFRDVDPKRQKSTASNRAKSGMKLAEIIKLEQEKRGGAPFQAHVEADVVHLMKLVSAMGGFRGVREWTPEAEQEQEERGGRITLNLRAVRDEAERIALERCKIVSDEPLALTQGGNTVAELSVDDEAIRSVIMRDHGAGPDDVEVVGLAMRLGEAFVVPGRDARLHLLARRDGTLLSTLTYQDVCPIAEVIPRADVMPRLFPMGLPLPQGCSTLCGSRGESLLSQVGGERRQQAHGRIPGSANL